MVLQILFNVVQKVFTKKVGKELFSRPPYSFSSWNKYNTATDPVWLHVSMNNKNSRFVTLFNLIIEKSSLFLKNQNNIYAFMSKTKISRWAKTYSRLMLLKENGTTCIEESNVKAAPLQRFFLRNPITIFLCSSITWDHYKF